MEAPLPSLCLPSLWGNITDSRRKLRIPIRQGLVELGLGEAGDFFQMRSLDISAEQVGAGNISILHAGALEIDPGQVHRPHPFPIQ